MDKRELFVMPGSTWETEALDVNAGGKGNIPAVFVVNSILFGIAEQM